MRQLTRADWLLAFAAGSRLLRVRLPFWGLPFRVVRPGYGRAWSRRPQVPAPGYPARAAGRALATLLRSSDATQPTGLTADELLVACRSEDIAALLYHHIGSHPAFRDWPADLQDELASDARAAAATELVAREELLRV